MIRKFQQGGGAQNAIMQFVQALAQTLQADPNEIAQAAQQNPKALEAAAQTYQETQDINQAAQVFTQALQQQVQAARHGAKLQYLKSLKNKCADDEELVYFKKGGSLDCGCKKKGGEVTKANMGAIANFKEDQKKKKQQKPKWTNIEDNELKTLSEKKTLTPKEKQRLQQLRDKFKSSSNTNNFEVEEGKNGIKVEKNCGGSAVVKKFKAKCGTKMKKHEQGGSLNGVPFMQKGTSKSEVKRNKAKEFYYPTKESTQEKVLNHFISQGLEIPEGRTEPGKFEYFLVDGLKLPPRIIKPTFDGLYNTGNFIKEIQSQPVVKESPYDRINKIINPIIKFINK